MDNFVVSARKYRPATFGSVVGQHHITSTLRNAINRSQLAHAYLFCGPRGVGKTTCARIFAKAINCLSPAGGEACNECESCRGFNEGRSFNIHELDAASNNSVDDIRSLTEQVRIPPQIGRYSVYIIDEVHMLSSSAFNAFLKTLEEPPAHALFILATTEKHKIIPTILSRCQIFDFNRIRVEDGVDYLRHIASQEGVAVDDESLHLIAQKADGGMRDALSMFDKAVSFCGAKLDFREVARTLNVLDYDTYFGITARIYAGDYPAVLTIFDDVLHKGFSPQLFVGGLNSHFRDLLMCKDPRTAPLLEMTGTLMERYAEQASASDASFLFEAISLLTTVDGTLRTATNQRLNVELALMKLCMATQKKNFDLLNPSGDTDMTLPDKATVERSAIPKQQTAVTVEGSDAAGEPTAGSRKGPAEPSESDKAVDSEPEKPKKTPAEVAVTVEARAEEEETTPEGPPETPAADLQAQQKPHENSPGHPSREDKMESRAAIHAIPQTISGPSIQDIMNSSRSIYELDEEEEIAQDGPHVDIEEDCAEKVELCRDRFIAVLKNQRPRIAVFFEDMSVERNTVKLQVPNETLYEEIMRNKTDILQSLADMAAVEAVLRLEVVVVEETTAKKPIRVEDKLAHLVGLNPHINRLRQKLNLDIE